jgi:hypothetical protein
MRREAEDFEASQEVNLAKTRALAGRQPRPDVWKCAIGRKETREVRCREE